jgi:hypothetical protein
MAANVSASINVLESFFKRTDAFGDEIKKIQEVYDDIQNRKSEYLKRESMLIKEKNDLFAMDMKIEGDFISLLKTMHGFQKEAVSVATEMYKRAQAEAMYRAQAEAAQRGLAETAHKVLAEATQRAKAEAEYRVQAESAQRQLIDQAERMQQDAAKRIQAEISKAGSFSFSPEKPADVTGGGSGGKEQKPTGQTRAEALQKGYNEENQQSEDLDLESARKKKMSLFK